jgi:hypothetical protein
MTQSYGPKSINDNLLVYLDARNIKSYAVQHGGEMEAIKRG